MTGLAMESRSATSMTRTDIIRVDLRVDHPDVTAEQIADTLGLIPNYVGIKGGVRGAKTYRVPAPGSTRATNGLNLA